VNRHSVLISCHSPFSSPQPYLQPLLPQVLCLLQCHHSLYFILPSSTLAPLFLAPQRSQIFNYAMPNELFRVPKDPRVHSLPYGPSTLSYLTLLSSVDFPTTGCKFASSNSQKPDTDPDNSRHNTADENFCWMRIPAKQCPHWITMSLDVGHSARQVWDKEAGADYPYLVSSSPTSSIHDAPLLKTCTNAY